MSKIVDGSYFPYMELTPEQAMWARAAEQHHRAAETASHPSIAAAERAEALTWQKQFFDSLEKDLRNG